jgi:putative protein kinase ArgK-like GTPase of G3E family
MDDQHERLTRAIEENAATAQSVSSAAGSTSSHSLADQILADQYLAAKRAQRAGVTGLQIFGRIGNSSG